MIRFLREKLETLSVEYIYIEILFYCCHHVYGYRSILYYNVVLKLSKRERERENVKKKENRTLRIRITRRSNYARAPGHGRR